LRYLAYVLLGILVVTPALTARAELKTLSVDEARKLVETALPDETKRLPGLDIEADTKANVPQCWRFDVLWSNQGEGSAHVAFYAVDRRTGDVWIPTSCTRVTSRAVAHAAQVVRKRLGISKLELVESRAQTPCCH
jgi:hypothetical protein